MHQTFQFGVYKELSTFVLLYQIFTQNLKTVEQNIELMVRKVLKRFFHGKLRLIQASLIVQKKREKKNCCHFQQAIVQQTAYTVNATSVRFIAFLRHFLFKVLISLIGKM